jgi:hypothetical protein
MVEVAVLATAASMAMPTLVPAAMVSLAAATASTTDNTKRIACSAVESMIVLT